MHESSLCARALVLAVEEAEARAVNVKRRGLERCPQHASLELASTSACSISHLSIREPATRLRGCPDKQRTHLDAFPQLAAA